VAAVAFALAAPAAPGADARTTPAPPGVGDPNAHLAAIVARSTPPTYRRFGSPGMAAAADDAARVLAAAGYQVVRHEAASHVWSVDYAAGHEPALVRVSDGRAFPTESAFELGATTPAEGISCAVRRFDQVGAGECGFVPYDVLSPEWNNFLGDLPGSLRTIRERGGVGAILQGDVEHGALIALKAAEPFPAVVALVQPADVEGQVVRLRAMGADGPATLHNVVGIRPPTDPSQGYIALQGHLAGWFTAAADNGGGAAAVLAAAERLAGDTGGRGLLVALYDGEEWGLRGSRALTRDLARPEGVAVGPCGPTVHLDDVVAVVNLDAPSGVASDVLGGVGDLLGQPVSLVSYRVLVFSEEPTVAALLATTSFANGVLGLPIPVTVANPVNGGVDRTDAKWWHEAGIPAAWTVVGYPEYHTTADTLEVVDPADLERVTAGAVDLVRALSTATIGRLDGSGLGPPGSSAFPPRPCGPPAGAAVQVAGAGELPATGHRVPVGPALGLLAVALGFGALVRYPARRS
jgi:Zn-dependent M28 family amino/carboxypeptidase